MRECGRSERPKNGADAQPYLSDVYKNGTRAKRRQADVALCTRIAENGADKVLSSEEDNSSVHKAYVNFPTSRKSALDVPLYAISSGRSMVEMLGVLAIIGVLSVGAMNGYSKAMFKYKPNKQAEQVNWLFNIIYQYKEQWVFDEPASMVPFFIKLDLIDKNMIHSDEQEKIFDSFGNSIKIRNNNAPSFNEIVLSMTLSESGSNRALICQNMFNIAKAHSPYLLYIRTDSREDISQDTNASTMYYGDVRCPDFGKGTNCIRYATLEDIYNVCQNCDKMPICYVSITWNI